MDFDFNNAYDGKRLTNRMRASVQSNGNLNFPPDVARHMGLSLDVSLLICPMGEKDLAVTVVSRENEREFAIKKTGPYCYVPFRSLLSESGIDCTKVRVVYDIIELKDSYEGHPVFKFNRRVIKHRTERWESGEVQAKAGYSSSCRDSIAAFAAWELCYITEEKSRRTAHAVGPSRRIPTSSSRGSSRASSRRATWTSASPISHAAVPTAAASGMRCDENR